MVGVDKPIVIIRCTSCGEQFDMQLKHAKFGQWSMPNKSKIIGMMREKGWMYTGEDMLCDVCSSSRGLITQ